MAKIVSIEQKEYFQAPGKEDQQYDGFVVTMDDGTILCMGVSSGQSCCEDFGAMCSEDDYTKFIGDEFLGYSVIDMETMEKMDRLLASERKVPSVDEGGYAFINVLTSSGSFEITIYNTHNGYYGHQAKVWYNTEVVFDEGF